MDVLRRARLWPAVALAIVAPLVPLGTHTTANASVAAAADAPPRHFVADTTPTWQTNDTVRALATANGAVYAGGEFTKVRPPEAKLGENETDRAGLAAFDAASGNLLPCAPEFVTETITGEKVPAIIHSLAVSADQTVLYVGGRFDLVNGADVLNFAAISLDTCSPLSGFPKVGGIVYAIEATPAAVYLGGDFLKVAGVNRTRLAAITPSGGCAPTRPTSCLQSWSPTADARVRALTVAPGATRVYAGGRFTRVSDQDISGIVALDPTTAEVVQTFPGWINTAPSWAAPGLPEEEVATLAHDDTNVYLGAEGNGPGFFDGRIAADAQTGALIWRDNCLGATQAVLPYQGVLYSASHAHDCSTTPGGFPENAMQGRQHFLSQDIADSTILPWFPDSNEGPGTTGDENEREGIGPYALAVADGVLWSGGEFTIVNGRDQQGLVRFRSGPDIGAPRDLVPPTAKSVWDAVELSWPAAWDRDDGTLTYTVYRDGEPIGTFPADSRYWDRPTLSYTDPAMPDGTYSYRVDVTDGSTIATGPTVTVEHTYTPVVEPPPPADTAPSSRITSPKKGTSVRSHKGVFKGTAADDHGVQTVQVALMRRGASGEARWWNGRRFVKRNATKPVWVRAQGTSTWRYEVGEKLPAPRGKRTRYVVLSRAVDSAGQVETELVRGVNKIRFTIDRRTR